MSRRIVRSVTPCAAASFAELVKRPASIVFRIFHCRMTSAFLMASLSALREHSSGSAGPDRPGEPAILRVPTSAGAAGPASRRIRCRIAPPGSAT